MKPSWSQHLEDEEVVDLFNPTHNPRDLAINQVLRQAVESWIEGNMEYATYLVSLADKYMVADKERFEELCSM